MPERVLKPHMSGSLVVPRMPIWMTRLYRQADRVVAADRQRDDLGRNNGGVEGGDLGERAFQGVGLLDPAIAEVAHARGVEWGDAVRVQAA
jgi:hypothetical protein